MGIQQSLQKTKDLNGQLQTKHKDKMWTSGVVYEVDCNNSLKKYTGETGRKLKEIIRKNGEIRFGCNNGHTSARKRSCFRILFSIPSKKNWLNQLIIWLSFSKFEKMNVLIYDYS